MKTCKTILLSLVIFSSTTANSFFNRFWLVRPAVVLGVTYGCLKLKNWVWPSVPAVPVKSKDISVEKLYQARLRGVKQSDLKFSAPQAYPARVSSGAMPIPTSSSDLGGESSGAASGTVTGPRPAVRVPVDGRNLSVQAEKAVMEQFRREGLDPIKNRDDFTRAYFFELDFLIAQRAAQRSATDSGSLRK